MRINPVSTSIRVVRLIFWNFPFLVLFKKKTVKGKITNEEKFVIIKPVSTSWAVLNITKVVSNTNMIRKKLYRIIRSFIKIAGNVWGFALRGKLKITTKSWIIFVCWNYCWYWPYWRRYAAWVCVWRICAIEYFILLTCPAL